MNQASSLFDDLDLNDLRIALEVDRQGTFRAAAAKLGVSHTTVARRVQALQDRLGARLFERAARGFVATVLGRQVVDAAQVLHREVLSLERSVLGDDQRLSGRIRLSVPDLLVTHLLMPDLVTFAARYPAIDLAVASTYDLVDLGGREADMALRLRPLGTSPREELVGRRIGAVHQCVYATPDWFERHPLEAPDAEATWTGWLGDEPESPAWVRASPFPVLRARHALEGAALQLAAAKAGLGLAMLPCLLGDPEPGLRRAPAVEPWPRWDLWVLVHPDLRRTTRLAVFRTFIVDVLTARRAILEGTRRDPADPG